ncbi:PREDICTED: mannan synthase 1-like [Erythranthe guttata]|uniref:mannan synthase 1-like n=1 Tax=Erythranthe guttata TaxID=4155 RepID=UPI00064D9463|nr:PREDICTED: mannan synthase 1-like [Erythranthe guttata]|eukprot:XP_012836037.1 PREDICTED: mannan synthase 1-like [Erythranthe guttata]
MKTNMVCSYLMQRVSIWKKWHVIYAFFFVRKIIAHWVTFFFYCIIIPATILVPEVDLPRPLAIYLPACITILNAASTFRLYHRSMHLLVFWILFENVMSLHRSKAAIIGLLEANRVNEWVVTEKLGNTMKQKYNAKTFKRPRSRITERIHILEIVVGMYLLHCAIYNMLYGHNHFFIYLLLQAGAFFIIGVGYIGTFVPN